MRLEPWHLPAAGWIIDRVICAMPRYMDRPTPNDSTWYRLIWAALNAFALNPKMDQPPK